MSDTHEDQFAAIWSAAKVQYAATTGADLDAPTFLCPASVDELLKSLEQTNGEFKHFREKRGQLFDILQGACKPIEQLGTILAGGANVIFPPSTQCMGAVLYLINAAHGVSSSYDAITELFETLKAFLVRLRVYNRERLPIELREKLAEILAIFLEVLARATKIVKAGTAGRFLSFTRNIFAGSEEKIQSLLEKLDKLCVIEDRHVGAETWAESRKTGRMVEAVSTKVDQITIDVQKISIFQEELRNDKRFQSANTLSPIPKEPREEKDSKHMDKVKAILKPSIHAHDILNSISKKRVRGTGSWIQAEPLFSAWKNQGNPLLGITGSPGSGKSFLSQSIVSYLQQEHPQEIQHPSRVSIGYFFFQDSDPDTRSFHQALRDIAYQICSNDPVYARHVVSSCQSVSDISTVRSAWRVLFFNYFISNDRIDSSAYLVLDGIDEASEKSRQTFFEHLSDLTPENLHSSGEARLRMILIGRPEISTEIAKTTGNTFPTISVDSRKNSSDIVQYVESSIKKSPTLSRAAKSLQEEVSTTLVQNAEGMFIWVDLMLCELAEKTHPSSIRRALHEAPKGLNEILKHVLESFSAIVSEEEGRDLNTMLAWVAFAQRPLKLGEIEDILRICSPEGDGMLNLESSLRKQFASFFSLVRTDGLTTVDLQDKAGLHPSSAGKNIVSSDDDVQDETENPTPFDSNPETTDVILCHASIGEYLRGSNNGKASNGSGRPSLGVDTVEAKVSILKTCLGVLCGNHDLQESQNDAPLTEYALESWLDFLSETVDSLNEIGTDDKKTIGNLLITMFRGRLVSPSRVAPTSSRSRLTRKLGAVIKWVKHPRFLNSLSHDDRIVDTRWILHAKPEFYSTGNVDAVIQWFEDPDFLKSLSQTDREWVGKMISKPAELFVIAAEVQEDQWQYPGYSKPDIIMQTFLMIKSALEGKPLLEVPKELPEETILHITEWAKLEKDALWHRKVGMCFTQWRQLELAKKYYSLALKLDSRMWIARAGLASTFALLGEYAEAIALAKRNEETIERLLKLKPVGIFHPDYCSIYDLSAACSDIALWFQKLKDNANAKIYYRKAFENSDQDYDSLVSWLYIAHFEKNSNVAEIMRVIRSLDEPIPDGHCTRLNECMITNPWSDNAFFSVVARAAKVNGDIEWLETKYQEAITVAKKLYQEEQASMLELCLADIYTLWDDKDEKAELIWDRIVSFPTTAAFNASWETRWCQFQARGTYAYWIFNEALRAGLDTSESRTRMARLDSLCKQKTNATLNAPEIITATYSSLRMGIWHRLCDREQESKPYFQPQLKEAIMKLSDNKPENDGEAYNTLVHALIAAGDEEYTRAACSVAPELGMVDKATRRNFRVDGTDSVNKVAESSQELRDKGVSRIIVELKQDRPSTGVEKGLSKTETVASATVGAQTTVTGSSSPATHLTLEDIMAVPCEVDDLNGLDYLWKCSGHCQTDFANWTQGNICRLCLLDFCEDCIAPLRRGEKLEENLCSPDHSWLHIEKPQKVVERGNIVIGEEVITLDEFLNRIKKRWDI